MASRPLDRDFWAETPVKILAGNFDVPEKIRFCFYHLVNSIYSDDLKKNFAPK